MLSVAVALVHSLQLNGFNVPVPSAVVPSRKVTAPVGVLVLEAPGIIVAVIETDCPVLEGLGEEVRVAVVVCCTAKLRIEEVLVRKLVSPA